MDVASQIHNVTIQIPPVLWLRVKAIPFNRSANFLMVRIYTNSSGLVQAHTSPGCIFRSMPWGHQHTPHKGWLIHFVRLMLDVIVTVDAVYDKPLDELEATIYLYNYINP